MNDVVGWNPSFHYSIYNHKSDLKCCLALGRLRLVPLQSLTEG
jgi:hypothetical protein